MRYALFAGALASIAVATAACGGGGGSGSSAVPAHAQNGALASGTAVMTIPNAASVNASSTKRKAQFLSASTVSVSASVNGGTPAVSDVSTTSPLCTTSTTGRTCAIPLNAPGGPATFVFTLYDGPNASGNILGIGTATQTITIGTAFSVNVAVGGVVATLAVSVPTIEAGPTSVPVTVTAKDADGNTIIGPAPYPNPIVLTNSDTSGTLTLSTTSVASPATAVTLAYTGGVLQTPATIGASTANVLASAITPASVMPINYFPINLTRTFSYVGTSVNTNGPDFIPIGTGAPFAGSDPSPEPFSGTYTQTIAGGVTFNGVSNVQSTTTIDTSTGLNPNINDISNSIYYRSIANNTVSIVGYTYFTPSFGASTVYPNGRFYAALPLVSGATTSVPFDAYTTTPASGAAIGPSSADAAGNSTSSYTSSDGSTETTHSSIDGTGSQTLTPGTGACGAAVSLGSYWMNGLPCNLTSATASVVPPAGGVVTVTVSQTSSSGTQTGTIAVPVSLIYPNGIPPVTGSVTTVGAPLAAAPSPCAVTPQVQGPIIPVTTATTTWGPVNATTETYTEVDYLAPGIGNICTTWNYNSVTALLAGSLATQTLPLQSAQNIFQYLYQYYGSETDSLTSVGPPTQPGTVIATGHARRSAGTRFGLGLQHARLPGSFR